MFKSFSYFGRFLALGVCASLFFACSEDNKSTENRLDFCNSGDMIGCLKGEWNLEQIERLDGNTNGIGEASGTLTFKNNMQYEFKGSVPVLGGSDQVHFHGFWNIEEGSLFVECTGAELGVDCPIPNSNTVTINIDASYWNLLRIHRAPFTNYNNQFIANPIEKYRIK